MNERENADGQTTRYDLGVLVVHGIGDQKQGATLTTWVDAVTGWLDFRGLKTSVRRARLRPPEGPAHVEVAIERSRGAKRPPHEEDWLFAEGWWASTFEPPSFAELWGWSFVSVPATAAMHANTVMGAALRRYRSANGKQRIYEAFRLVVILLLLVTLVMVSPLILVLFTVLFLLGLVASVLPIDALRTAVMKAQLISIGTIGDTKRLIDSPTHAGAIKSPVIDGIHWLRAKGCEKVVVLAHSQGAAVTYQALADLGAGLHGPADAMKIDSFISVGSGLPKVHQLQYLSSGKGKHLRFASLLVPAAAVTTALSIRFLSQRDALAGLAIIGVIAVLTGALVAAIGLHGRRKAQLVARTAEVEKRRAGRKEAAKVTSRTRFRQIVVATLGLTAGLLVALPFDQSLVTIIAVLATLAGLTGLAVLAIQRIPPVPDTLEKATDRWVDIYSSGDPVPAGPTRTEVRGRPESWRVTNLGSIVRDHNAYPINQDECLSFVGTELGNISGMLRGRERHRIRLDRSERLWRVGWKVMVGYAMGAASIVFAWTTWRGADDALQDGYRRLMASDGVVGTWYPGDLPGWVPTTMSSAAAQTVAVIGYIMISQVAVQVGNGAWSAWNSAAAAADLEWQKKRGRLNEQELRALDELVEHEKKGNPDIDPPSGIPATERHERASSDHDVEPADPRSLAGDTAFAVMIGLVVLGWFVALAPQWAWASWRSLDLTSWRGLGVLSSAIGAALAVGVVVPRLVARTNFKDWVLGRDISRIEGLVAYGDYQLNQLDRLPDAVKSFEAANKMAKASGHDDPDALAAHARSLIARAERARVQIARPNQAASDKRRWRAEALADEKAALDLYDQACRLRRLVSPRTRVEYARELHRLNRDDETGTIDAGTRNVIVDQLAAARDQDGLAIEILDALVAHQVPNDDDEPAWQKQLRAALANSDLDDAERVAPLFTLIAAGGHGEERVQRLRKLRRLIAAGHLDPRYDPEPALLLTTTALPTADGSNRGPWPAHKVANLREFADALTGRVDEIPDIVLETVDVRASQEQPTNA